MTTAIRVMGVSIALQLPSQLYIGGLMGLQRQVRANSIQIGWGVVGSAMAVYEAARRQNVPADTVIEVNLPVGPTLAPA